eukprot:TRINITY_DN26549_c0_g1_i1.p2 TRINITY_DN26549_c0_g1~~TRINITY_DN26549_c0_g1_i1.p2  ORF type:complete len:139 (-),score=3.35 TRINITY_DN26549_c0_g1_i1:201-617(-)
MSQPGKFRWCSNQRISVRLVRLTSSPGGCSLTLMMTSSSGTLFEWRRTLLKANFCSCSTADRADHVQLSADGIFAVVVLQDDSTTVRYMSGNGRLLRCQRFGFMSVQEVCWMDDRLLGISYTDLYWVRTHLQQSSLLY